MNNNRWLLGILVLALGVLLAAPGNGLAGAYPCANSFDLLFDTSGSMTKAWKQGACGDMRKFTAQKKLALMMNDAIPDNGYDSALRKFGFEFYTPTPAYESKLVYGPAQYNKAEFAAALQDMEETSGITPLGPAISHSEGELAMWSGVKALIIMSDFKRDPGFGNPIEEATKLKAKYGGNLVIHTIGLTYDADEIAVAQGVAQAGGGTYWNACELLNDRAAFDEMINTIFCVYAPMVPAPCIDSDQDGYCDDVDQCPGTPIGAVVDERGCWIGAYESYFDFDKAVIKAQYMPNIKAAADVLKANPGLYVSLDGHTDSIGSEQYNDSLGMRRANAVKQALVKFGVQSTRMKVKSYGESRPIASNDTPEGRATNRRVEINVWQAGY